MPVRSVAVLIIILGLAQAPSTSTVTPFRNGVKQEEQRKFLEKMARKNKILQAPLPKFELVRDEVGRVNDFLRTMDEDFDAVGNSTVDVDRLESDIAALLPMKTKLNDMSAKSSVG